MTDTWKTKIKEFKIYIVEYVFVFLNRHQTESLKEKERKFMD